MQRQAGTNLIAGRKTGAGTDCLLSQAVCGLVQADIMKWLVPLLKTPADRPPHYEKLKNCKTYIWNRLTL
jgi:hypothetical protein